jgi:hypothetical protein
MKEMSIIKSKRGWVRLIEVFVAILLLTGILLVVANRTNPTDKNVASTEMSKKQFAILEDIELNDTFRAEILNVPSLPLEWNYFNVSGLQNLKDRIEYLTPENFECMAKICSINGECKMNELSNENIYAESVFISANFNVYSPRLLKLFCIRDKI